MKNRGVFRLLVLVTVFISARAEVKKSYFLNGGKLTLGPTVTPPITSILWKHNGDLLAEWIENNVPLTYYGDYDGRTNLTIETGHLVIGKMDETKDSGEYTLEINNKVHGDSYDAKVITEVPKPEVWIRPLTCNGQQDNCTLSCDGKIPEAQPITYTWKKDDKVWDGEVGETVDFFKTQTKHVKTFSCSMKNPVSEKKSQPIDNPFFDDSPPPSSSGEVVAAVLVPLLILAGIGLGFWQRDRIRGWISPSDSGNAAGPASVDIQGNGNETVNKGLMKSDEEDGKRDPPVSPPDSPPE